MKNIKKFGIGVLIGLSFAVTTNAFALSLTPSPVYDSSTIINVGCSTTSNNLRTFAPSGGLQVSALGCGSTTRTFSSLIGSTSTVAGTYNSLEDSDAFDQNCSGLSYADCVALIGSGNLAGTASIVWSDTPPPPPSAGGIAIFGGLAHQTSGTPTAYTGSALVANVATALGNTNMSLLPIVAIVVGIILTILISRWLVGIFYEADVKKDPRIKR